MNIVTPSHSNDDPSNPYNSDLLLPPEAAAAMTTTTNNYYFDSIWIHGRTLTDTEWNELSTIKVRGSIQILSYPRFPVMNI